MSALAPSRSASSSASRLPSSAPPLPDVIGAIIPGGGDDETEPGSHSSRRGRSQRPTPHLLRVGAVAVPAAGGRQRVEAAAQEADARGRGGAFQGRRDVYAPDTALVPQQVVGREVTVREAQLGEPQVDRRR